MKGVLPVGKVSSDLLDYLLSGYSITDPSIIVGPKVGEDAAIIDVGESYLVAKTDPITFATDEIGWYLVCICGNDIAAMGACPRWLLVTVLLPEGKTTEEMVNNIFTQITSACKAFNITLCGGHTEITHGLDRPIIVGQMLGLIEKDRVVINSGAQIGDDILLTKGIAIEAISVIAREREDILLKLCYSGQYIDKAKSFLRNPGISVLKEAMIATGIGGIHAMHDPTEGGLATGLAEIARCSGVGMVIQKEKIHIFQECRDLCREFNIDPLGVIASGALIIVASPLHSDKIVRTITENGIYCSVIGKITEKDMIMKNGSYESQFPKFEADEITRIF